jgi:hypothetical protein
MMILFCKNDDSFLQESANGHFLFIPQIGDFLLQDDSFLPSSRSPGRTLTSQTDPIASRHNDNRQHEEQHFVSHPESRKSYAGVSSQQSEQDLFIVTAKPTSGVLFEQQRASAGAALDAADESDMTHTDASLLAPPAIDASSSEEESIINEQQHSMETASERHLSRSSLGSGDNSSSTANDSPSQESAVYNTTQGACHSFFCT